MLHSSSLHYYACYYALLCLLHHQQQAASVTIIIDGATTTEWATRDEYQRLVDSSQGLADVAPAAAPNPAGRQSLGDTSDGGPSNGASATAKEQWAEQILRSISGGGASGSGSGTDNNYNSNEPIINRQLNQLVAQRLIPAGQIAGGRPQQQQVLPSNSLATQQQRRQQQQQQQQAQTGAQQASSDDLLLALDRLDLIEQERKSELQRLNKIRLLEKLAETNVVSALARSTSKSDGPGETVPTSEDHSTGNSAPRIGGPPGARTISDLVPLVDNDLLDPHQRLREREAPKKWCGNYLNDVLDIVCHSRFYAGGSEPQVVEPTVKMKRSVDQPETGAAVLDSQNGDSGAPSRRRKLRTLTPRTGNGEGDRANDGDGEPRSSYPSQAEIINRIHNQQQRQLASSQQSTGNNQLGEPRQLQSARGRKLVSSRQIRGAHSECCLQACYMEQLKRYCKP